MPSSVSAGNVNTETPAVVCLSVIDHVCYSNKIITEIALITIIMVIK